MLITYKVRLSPDEAWQLPLAIIRFVAKRPEGLQLICTPYQIPSTFAHLLVSIISGNPNTASISYSELSFLYRRYDVKTWGQRRLLRRKLRRVIRTLLHQELVAHCVYQPSVIPEWGDVYEYRILTREQASRLT